MTRALTPSPSSRSAAATAWSTVMPQATMATSSPSCSDAAAADRHLLVGRRAHLGLPAQRAQVGDALAVGHRGDELRRLVGVGRVQHAAAVDRAERREVLQRHLRRAVLADRHAGVRARQAQVRPRDRRHADEVVGAREERRERRGERLPVAHLHADRRRDHLLLRDEHLEVAVRVRLAEHLRVRRVRDLAVDRHDVAVDRAERGDRLAVGLAGRDLLAERPRSAARRRGRRTCAGRGRRRRAWRRRP